MVLVASQAADNDTGTGDAKHDGTAVATPDQSASAEATPAQATGSSQSAPAPSPSISNAPSGQGNSTAKYNPKNPVYVDSSKLLSSGRPTPVAAYAIPLSAAAVALLIAGGLAIRHRGALRKERDKEKKTLQLLEKLSGSSDGTGDAKLGSTAPQLPHPMQLQPIPLFMPIPVSLSSSSSIRQQASLSGGYTYPAAGEPRQITRNACVYESPVSVDRSASGRSCRHSISGGRSTPSPPSRSARIRNLSISSTCFSPSPTIVTSGARDGPSLLASSSSPSYLPPLSFTHSLSRESPSHLSRGTTMLKEPSRVSDGYSTTSDILQDYCPSPRMDSDARARPLPSYAHHSSYPVEPPLPPSLISAPQRLYVRNEAPSSASFINGHPADLYSHTNTYGGQRDVYAAVASLIHKSCP